MTKVPTARKISAGTSISIEASDKLFILREKKFIRSMAEGIRLAVNEWLRKPEVVEKLNEDVNQSRIVDFGKK